MYYGRNKHFKKRNKQYKRPDLRAGRFPFEEIKYEKEYDIDPFIYKSHEPYYEPVQKFMPSHFYENLNKNRLKAITEYPRYFYDTSYGKPSKKQLYENIYWMKKKPSKMDEMYGTILAASRGSQYSSSNNINDINNMIKHAEKVSDFVDQNYKEQKRIGLIRNALLNKYVGEGFYGGAAVDFPKHENINPEKINEYQKVSLSNHDISKLLHGQTNIFTYPQLSNFNNIEEVLEPYNCCVILYMTKKNYGHWCCLTQHKDRISFFDPYGGQNLPDEELKNIPEHFRRESGQDFPHLSYLLYNSGYPIEYNNYKFQKHKQDTNTCGRHCINRIRNRHLNIDQYYEMMKGEANRLGIDYDQLVTLNTSS